MEKRWACITLSIIMVFSLAACSVDSSVNLEETEMTEDVVITEETVADDSVTNEPVEEETIEIDEPSAEELALFQEFDLLNIEREANSIENGFVQADFIIQNKSDSLTISNFVFEYLVDNGSGTPLEETFSTDDYDGLFALEPRQKAELGLREYIGSEINEDMRIFVISYSYDLNESNYVVSIPDQKVSVSNRNIQSNVDFQEKHVLQFESIDAQSDNRCIFTNIGELDIKALEISVAVYDEHSVLHDIETVTVVAPGDDCISSNGKGSVSLNPIHTRDNGYLVPVRYSYGTGNADNNGYNVYEINLITGEALGTSDVMLMDNMFDMSADELRSEIELFTNTFGKKITDTPFEGYEIEERVGSEWLHFHDSTLFGVQGIATLVRDYDTLILTDFWFFVENHDETTAAYFLKALELVYGEEYESETENGTLEQALWILEEYNVEYDVERGSLHIDTDIE